jgi:hypothetical protein
MEATFKGLLSRNNALRIREITFDIFVHPNKDPGCRGEADLFLRSFCRQYAYALVVFDREGCGSEDSRIELEISVEQRLSLVGWTNRSIVVVLDPELEVWLWTQSPHVEEALGWEDREPSLRTWLVENGFMEDENHKPNRPKEALEIVLRKVKKPRSSAIYMQIAQKVSLVGHQEPAFLKLITTLYEWFPEEQDQ